MATFVGAFAADPLLYPTNDNDSFPSKGSLAIGDRGYVDMAPLLTGDFVNGQPIGEAAQEFAGYIGPSYFNDYYDRVWIIPTVLDFGPITTDTSKLVFLWNAHLDRVRFTGFGVDDDSLSINGLPTGVYIPALGGFNFSFVASAVGQPTIDAQASFSFSPTEIVNVAVTGIRARLWPWLPNWANGVQVTVEYRTEVITSDNGKEQRIAIRQRPRKNISESCIVNEGRFQTFKRQMNAWLGRSTIVADATRFGKLAVKATHGEPTLLVSEVEPWMVPEALIVLLEADSACLRTIRSVTDNEIELSATVEGNWLAGSKVFKAVAGHLGRNINSRQRSNNVAEVDLDFNSDPGYETWPEPPAAPATYLGRELVLKRPNWANGLENGYQSYREEVDYGRGRMDFFYPIEYNDLIMKATFVGRDYDDAQEMEELFHRMRGQQGEFFMPTFTDDITIINEPRALQSQLRIAGTQFSRDFARDTIHKNLIIFFANGTNLIRRVQDIFETSDSLGNDSIVQVTAPFGRDIDLKDIRQICWLPLWRFASDSLTMEYLTDEVAQFAINFKTLEFEVAE